MKKRNLKIFLILGLIAVFTVTIFVWLGGRDGDRSIADSNSKPVQPTTNPNRASSNSLDRLAATRQSAFQGKTAAANANQNNSRQDKLRGAVEAMNVPVEFWGKTVDQNNVPLAGVRVKVRLRSWAVLSTPDGDAIFNTKEVVSGNDGAFAIDGGKGDVLTIVSLQKDGYDAEPVALKSYGYTSADRLMPDPNNPVIFKLWAKENASTELVSGSNRFGIIPDGRVYTINLLNGKSLESASSEGDLRISIQRTVGAKWGQNFDWSLSIEPVAGGILEVTDTSDSMFQAPAEGYTKQYSLQVSSADPNWSYATGLKRFFLNADGGKHYARIEMEVYAFYLQDKQARINLKYALNPVGSRILRGKNSQ